MSGAGVILLTGALDVFLDEIVITSYSIHYTKLYEPTFVVTYDMSGMESTLWVTEEGGVMRERTSQGFESVKEPESIARDMGQDPLSVSSVITLSLVKPASDIPRPETRRRMKLLLTNIRSPEGIPEDHRQKIP